VGFRISRKRKPIPNSVSSKSIDAVVNHSRGRAKLLLSRFVPSANTPTARREPRPPKFKAGFQDSHRRGGSVLLIVLVVVVFLSLGAYTFSELMLVEAETARLYGRRVQARAFADSGVDYVTALLDNDKGYSALNSYHNPELFQGVIVQEGDQPRTQGRFSIIAADESDPNRQAIRFGLADESGKLNLNALSRVSDSEAKGMLMALPGMTIEIAEPILDWLDTNSDIRDYGAEEDYYLALSTPYGVKNGPLESLDELLLVKGMTPFLLYGEDANRNGILDPSENDGDLTQPSDNGDGMLDLGFSAYMTVNSREANLRSDGSPKIDISSDKLDELYDSLQAEFDEEVAKFVVAYRLFGPTAESSRRGPSGGSTGGSGSSGSSSGGSSGGSSGVGTGQTLQQDDTVGTGEVGGETADQGGSGGGQTGSSGGGSSSRQNAVNAGRGIFGGQGQVTRGGMELSGGAQHPVNSIFDLIGVSVKAKINDQDQTLESPWSENPSEMRGYLSELDDALTTIPEENLAGRLNINEAAMEVLRGVPNMTEELAYDIVTRRITGVSGESMAGQIQGRDTIGWLVTENVTDLPTLRKIAPFLTAGGDVYTVNVLGYFDAGAPLVRLEAVIDATQTPTRVISVRDLTPLGIGFPRALFDVEQ